MVSLRQFTDRDAAVIREKQMPSASPEEISGMIEAWEIEYLSRQVLSDAGADGG